VGAWAADKTHYLLNYINATKKVRAGFLPPPAARGGAAFIDLFAGPGKKRIGTTGEIVSGSPLTALEHGDAPFTKVIACDIEAENVAALRARTASSGRCVVIEGDCNLQIDEVLNAIPKNGLNMALIDPFGLKQLKFSTVSALGALQRMDLILHFPTGDIKRNLIQAPERTGMWLDDALGTTEWRRRQRDATDVNALVEVLVEQLRGLKYTGARFHAPAIKNTTKVPLYHLVFASKNPLGDKIWASIIRTEPSGQSSLPGF